LNRSLEVLPCVDVISVWKSKSSPTESIVWSCSRSRGSGASRTCDKSLDSSFSCDEESRLSLFHSSNERKISSVVGVEMSDEGVEGVASWESNNDGPVASKQGSRVGPAMVLSASEIPTD